MIMILVLCNIMDLLSGINFFKFLNVETLLSSFLFIIPVLLIDPEQSLCVTSGEAQQGLSWLLESLPPF